MQAALQKHMGQTFTCVRGFQFCANMCVRNVYTSDNVYTAETLPRDMSFPVSSTTVSEQD